MGTSKVSVLIGEIVSKTSLHIVGFGECQSHGIVKGAVVDARRASEAVHTAISAAEKAAGDVRVNEIYLAQTGGHLEGFYNDAEYSVSSADGRVSRADVRMVERLAQAKQLPEGRLMVEALRRPYRVDGLIVKAPEGIAGKKIQTGYWMVHADAARLKDSIGIAQDYQLHVRGLVLSSLASGRIVTSPLERQNGALALDIGAGTTDYVLYRDGAPQAAGVVTVGGSHLTNDLSLGLRIREGQAELLKTRHGRATLTAKDRNEKVWIDGNMGLGDRQVPRMAIEQILSERTRELFEVVKKKLGNAFTPEGTPAGVVLTGGTAKLEGIDEMAKSVFGVAARVGEAPSWVDPRWRDPRHSTVLGVLNHVLQAEQERFGQEPTGIGGFIKGLFGGGK
jgi:cell division protein FtsA